MGWTGPRPRSRGPSSLPPLRAHRRMFIAAENNLTGSVPPATFRTVARSSLGNAAGSEVLLGAVARGTLLGHPLVPWLVRPTARPAAPVLARPSPHGQQQAPRRPASRAWRPAPRRLPSLARCPTPQCPASRAWRPTATPAGPPCFAVTAVDPPAGPRRSQPSPSPAARVWKPDTQIANSGKRPRLAFEQVWERKEGGSHCPSKG
jgi:hypothetical protein